MSPRSVPPQPTDASPDASWFAVVAHPLRIRILCRFLAGTNVVLTPKVLADDLGAALGVVSYHMRALHEHRVLRLVKREQVRGAFSHRYRLSDPDRVAERLWGLTARLLRVPDADAIQRSDATVVVDASGLAQIRAATDRYLVEVAEIGRRARARFAVAAAREPSQLEARAADGWAYRVAILFGVDDER